MIQYTAVKKPRIAIIAALAQGRVIGYHNRLPWDVPTDLRYFKQMTQGKTVIMGRKTYESIGRLLPHRENIIVSTQPSFHVAGAQIASSLESAIATALLIPNTEEIMIIGGATLYEAALPLADRLYLTLLDLETMGDTYFPEWHHLNWHETASQPFFDEQAQVSGKFIVLDK